MTQVTFPWWEKFARKQKTSEEALKSEEWAASLLLDQLLEDVQVVCHSLSLSLPLFPSLFLSLFPLSVFPCPFMLIQILIVSTIVLGIDDVIIDS